MRLVARPDAQLPPRMLADVQTISRSVSGLDLVEVFEQGGPNPFIGWFRAVSSAVRCLRCVFDDSEAHARLVHGLRLQNLDSGILGSHYEEESLVIESGKNHFDLLGPELIAGHLERMLATLT
jgi:hypothetical protein